MNWRFYFVWTLIKVKLKYIMLFQSPMNASTHVYNILSNVQKLAKAICGVKFYPFQ